MPSSYHKKFFEKFCMLQQGSQSVKEYHKEFLYLLDKANIKRSPDVIMGQFLFGLNTEIADRVELHPYATMEDLVYLAIEVEKQLQFMASWFSSDSNSIWGSEREKFEDKTKSNVPGFKESSSKPISTSSSKSVLEEFVEYAVDGELYLEELNVQNF